MKLTGALLLAAAASVLAEGVIDFTKLPACAKDCDTLKAADTNCVPPAAPVTTQQIYQSCVCQSTLLLTLKSSGAVCATACTSQDDQTKISQYYVALCNGPVVQPAATTTTTTATTTATSATGTATGLVAGVGNKAKPSSGGNGWFSTHWKWVVMVIVIVVACLIGSLGGLWLKRRHDRKKEAAKANMAATDSLTVSHNTPGSRSKKSTLGKGPMSTPDGYNPYTPSPVTMSGGRNGMAMDGGVGGIAPPRAPPKLRSRSNTLQSMGTANGSKSHLPHQPVAWGPHQYQAYAKEYGNDSPSNSIPPSPTAPIHPPGTVVFRTRSAMNSDSQIGYHPTTGLGAARAVSVNHGLAGMRSDPTLNPAAVPQAGEICEVSPKRLHKQRD
ncbi:hypothetical protein BCR34DRAFT_601376 [Clohesyomyces aquaticus]|uniref:CFEM domain-containing protein n=1 Tax=Clohesyomyces aquaticus TaxID=1231657 RepID=A0A1Y1ZMI1_9PLEO|nr:hypothetical protein BCR34DRAFT_601376 [Clohesyomyces aquaticus]